MSAAATLFAQISATRPVKPATRTLRRAVVLGGSMAGLMAARVLSDHADEVVVVERDESSGDGPRAGVPQGNQGHALLAAGGVQLERWYPGIVDEAVAAGAVTLPRDGSRSQLWVNGGLRPRTTVEADVPVLVSTRPFLEKLVRARTVALENVTQVPGRAWGLEFAGSRVSGVRYTHDGDTVTLDADLVVDATGRASRLSDWLEEAGWERPPLQRMPIKVNYATTLFAYDEAIADKWSVISQANAAGTADGRARIGGLLRVEDDRWIMLLSGYVDDRPSTDPEEFAERCRRDFPDIFGDIATKATMVGEIGTYHQADSRRRDFHAVTRFPAGLLAIGDAVASFNPVYGQGMTASALHASCLARYLASSPDHSRPAKEYFDLVRVIVDAAWRTSTFADLALPHVEGPYPRGYRVIRWLTGKIFKAALTDRTVNQRLARITTMLAHPSTLVTPATLARALRPGRKAANPR
jgi:2-polyprenyl-6-methoxyphenol hydroxylase-like FAD-dependent oxidoreductase